MKTVTLEDRTAELLGQQARERGLALDAYLSSLALLHAGAVAPPTQADASTRSHELNVALDELFAGEVEPPAASADVPDRRQEIYADHD